MTFKPFASVIALTATFLPACNLCAQAQRPPTRATTKVTAVRLTGTGHFLVTGDSDGTVSFWETGPGGDTKPGDRWWSSRADWRRTAWVAIRRGKSRYDDQIVDATDEPNRDRLASLHTQLPVLALFFRDGGNQVLAVERWGGIRVLDTETGTTIRNFGVFFGVKKGLQLETIGGADYDPIQDRLVLSGQLLHEVYTIDMTAALAQKSPLIVLDSWLRELDLEPPSSLVRESNLDIPRSTAASAEFLSSNEEDDRFAGIRICGRFVAGITYKANLVVWTMSEKGGDPTSYYLREIRRSMNDDTNKDGFGLACIGQSELLTVGVGGKYGDIQRWNLSEGAMIEYHPSNDSSSSRRVEASSEGKRIFAIDGSVGVLWTSDTGQFRQTATVTLSVAPNAHDLLAPISLTPDGTQLAVVDQGCVSVINTSTLSVTAHVPVSGPCETSHLRAETVAQ